MKVINMYAGPGAGKSSVAADLFALMKWHGMNVELVDEYAKELSWENRKEALEDQIYVMAKQNRKLWRLKDQVDYAITDSSIILAPLYSSKSYMPKYFEKLTHEAFQSYDNLNIYLNRTKPFSQVGRHHDEDQSRKKDKEIVEMLLKYDYDFAYLDADRNTKFHIMEILRELEK